MKTPSSFLLADPASPAPCPSAPLRTTLAQGGSNAADGGFGGAIEDGPGVDLAILNCSFTGNQANSGGGSGVDGGAIDNSPAVTVTISDSQFISNSAIGSGVGAVAEAGAVDNYQTMTIANCLFAGNSAVAGPMADGVHTFGQALGGAILTGYGLSDGVTVILTLSNSIVAGNEAIGGSGGSTLAFARTDAGFGGGISNIVGGTLNITGCTITGNQALGGATASGSGGVALGGGILQSTIAMHVKPDEQHGQHEPLPGWPGRQWRRRGPRQPAVALP